MKQEKVNFFDKIDGESNAILEKNLEKIYKSKHDIFINKIINSNQIISLDKDKLWLYLNTYNLYGIIRKRILIKDLEKEAKKISSLGNNKIIYNVRCSTKLSLNTISFFHLNAFSNMTDVSMSITLDEKMDNESFVIYLIFFKRLT